MTEGDAIRAAEAFGIPDGETVTVQSDGQVTHPHYSEGVGAVHVDGWEVTNNDGTYIARKIHAS